MPLLERMPLLEPTEVLAGPIQEMPILQRMPQLQETEDVGVKIIDLTQDDDDDCDVIQEMPLPTSLLGVQDTIISDNCTSTELSARPISLLFCNYL